MKKVMFYCQHILGMGDLIRSVEIVKGLIYDFEILFINGGQVIDEFQFPPEIEVINIPAVTTDSEFNELRPVDKNLTMEEVETIRKKMLLETCDRFKPDIMMIELYPFGRRRFSFELIPLVEKAKSLGTKIVSSVRDIVITKQKQNQQQHEENICRLINKYFDMLLIHGDPNFVKLNLSFSRVDDLNCPVHYTGYVVQPIPKSLRVILNEPTILVSVGGGKFGHDLLECVARSAPILQDKIPYKIQMFTGPFCPESVFNKLQKLAKEQENLSVTRYSPNLIDYMQQADLSIGMSGYNTTMNILSTGVKAMMMAFQGNNDQEQEARLKKLDSLGRVKMIHARDLVPEKFALKIVDYLQQSHSILNLNVNGVNNTKYCLYRLKSKQSIERRSPKSSK